MWRLHATVLHSTRLLTLYGVQCSQENTQVGDAWTARTLMFCDHTEGDITRPTFYASPVVSTPVDGMAGRLYPGYMEASGVAVKYDESSEVRVIVALRSPLLAAALTCFGCAATARHRCRLP